MRIQSFETQHINRTNPTFRHLIHKAEHFHSCQQKRFFFLPQAYGDSFPFTSIHTTTFKVCINKPPFVAERGRACLNFVFLVRSRGMLKSQVSSSLIHCKNAGVHGLFCSSSSSPPHRVARVHVWRLVSQKLDPWRPLR